jgi:N-acetylneuraminic acid mutarotase
MALGYRFSGSHRTQASPRLGLELMDRYRRNGLTPLLSVAAALLTVACRDTGGPVPSAIDAPTFSHGGTHAGAWTSMASMPTARGALAADVVNGMLYAVGGYNGTALATVEAYDPASNTWTSNLPPMPTARYFLAAGVVNGTLYAVGGCCSGALYVGTVDAYDGATWTAKASMPTRRRSLGVGVVNGMLYAVGGFSNSGVGTDTVEAYNPATNTWTRKASMRVARGGLAVGVVNGILYAVGGASRIGVNDLATVEAYNPATDTWTTKTSMPAVRTDLAVGVVDGILYAVGGYRSGPLATVEAYDAATNTWTTLASMSTARQSPAAGAVNGILYALGGYSATVEAYQPSCRDQGGPLTTLSGQQAGAYSQRTLPNSQKIDARTAQFTLDTNVNQPTRIGGGRNLCWSGGEVLGRFPPSRLWSPMHDTYGHQIDQNTGDMDVEDIRVFNYGDGIKNDKSGSNWRVRRVYVKYARDDCVENDLYRAGTIEDSFFDGCYVGIASRQCNSCPLGDSSANVVVVRKSLFRLGAVDRAFDTSAVVPNHNGFWKWHANSPRIALYDNVFRADAAPWGGNTTLVPPSAKRADCANNVMIWLGPAGQFPEALPSCFTLLEGPAGLAYWNNAANAWHAAHPRPPSLLDVAPPIVSMFQPGIVGDTVLTGTDTLWATASDDQAVVRVRFMVDGDSIGDPQTSSTEYRPLNKPKNVDLVNKYRITWNSATVTNGPHKLRAVATDARGHVTTSDSVSVTVSNPVSVTVSN